MPGGEATVRGKSGRCRCTAILINRTRTCWGTRGCLRGRRRADWWEQDGRCHMSRDQGRTAVWMLQHLDRRAALDASIQIAAQQGSLDASIQIAAQQFKARAKSAQILYSSSTPQPFDALLSENR